MSTVIWYNPKYSGTNLWPFVRIFHVIKQTIKWKFGVFMGKNSTVSKRQNFCVYTVDFGN